MVSAEKKIKDGRQFDKYFEPAIGGVVNLGKKPVEFTVAAMHKITLATLDHTKKIARVLEGKTVLETASNVWHFYHDYVAYKEDDKLFEQLRNPRRLWQDRHTGVDCDCFSISIKQILINLGIESLTRLAEYDNKGYYQHVYIVIPQPNGEIIIDPVWHRFNEQKKYTKKQDFMINHQYLNGIGATGSAPLFGEEFSTPVLNGLGLGNVNSNPLDVLNEATRAHLKNTFDALAIDGKAYKSTVDVDGLKAQIAYALQNWDNPIARAAVLEELEEMDELAETAPVKANPTGHFTTSSASAKVRTLQERRKKNPRLVPATIRRGTLPGSISPNRPKTTNRKCDCNPSLAGLNGKSGFWSKVKNAGGKVVDKIKETGGKVVDKIKEVGGEILEHNPISFAIRKALIFAFKQNMFQFSARLAPVMSNDNDLKAAGFDAAQLASLRKTFTLVEGIFKKIGGSTDELKQAIQEGKNKFDSKNAVNGLGVAAAAAAAASAVPAAGVIAKIATALKKVNFKKLFEAVKNIAPAIKERIANGRNNEPADLLNEVNATVDVDVTEDMGPAAKTTSSTPGSFARPGTSPNAGVPSSSVIKAKIAEGITSEVATEAKNPEDYGGKKKGSNTALIVGGIAALGILGGLAYYNSTQKSNKKALNGLVTAV